MRKSLFKTTRKVMLALLLTFGLAAPALACECAVGMPDPVTTNHAYSLADVTVRGMSMANHQSALAIDTVRRGFLTAQYIRAKFSTGDCGVVPQYQRKMTVLLKAEDDGSYSIAGQCETRAALAH
ncbi:MAG: hypothetical protein H6865_04010 [Rhodospirillales bacterium]|nr:hypothetical protein [Alphaproteobacteria bacterium]MCB9986782.1 hypothetical protein [Rhodospirillales bacterium]USO08449.1 MAG: hypothetical protein H6866_04365 [Rhodospirillales bacterium]